MCEKECLHAPVCVKSKECMLGRIQGTGTAECAYFLADNSCPTNEASEVTTKPEVQCGSMLYMLNTTNANISQYCVSECFVRDGKWFIKMTQDKGSLVVTETMSAEQFNGSLGRTLFRRYRDAIMAQIK